MRFLDRVDISGSVVMASTAKDQFTIGTPLENNDGNVDNLTVHANADFKNNVILGSSSIDTVTANATITASSGLSASNLYVQNDITASGLLTIKNLNHKVYTSAPNNLIPVVGLETTSSTVASVDLSLTAQGNGSLLRTVPDSTAVGGNKRGIYAVDLQSRRDFNYQVPSAQGSAILAGQKNQNDCYLGVVNCGSDNYIAAGAMSAIVGGQLNVIETNAYYSSIVSGFSNRIYVNSAYSVTNGGYYCRNDGSYSVVLGGAWASVRGINNRIVYGAGRFAAQGDAQFASHATRVTSSDSTSVILTSNALAPSTTLYSINVNVMPNNSSYKVKAEVVAREPSTKVSKAWTLECLATRGANAASTVIDGTVNVTTFGNNVSASAWDATIVANTTRGSIEIQCTGEANKTIYWVGKMDTVEVVG